MKGVRECVRKSIYLSLFQGVFTFCQRTTLLWLLVFCSLSAQAQVPVGTPVGTTAGSFQVDSNGAATYSIPLHVPPGTNAVEPTLSLDYNSHQGNGLLGMGWNLSGLSAIGRCSQTQAQDGDDYVPGIHFDVSDRFCIDGQRLVLYEEAEWEYCAIEGETCSFQGQKRVKYGAGTSWSYEVLENGTPCTNAVFGDPIKGTRKQCYYSRYGEPDTRYHTEHETRTEFVAHGNCGSGPCTFTATTKDGHQLEFATTDDSRIQVPESQVIIVWAINKITDRNGNYVAVSYGNNGHGQSYPQQIKYTGNNTSTPALTPQRAVSFEYEERPDSSTQYFLGTRKESTKRLHTISTYVDQDGDGLDIIQASNLVKSYQLSYDQGATTKRSRITGIQECGSDGLCLPKTMFDSSQGNNGFVTDQDWGTRDNNKESSSDQWMVDMNADGLTDYVYQKVGTRDYRVLLNNGSGYGDDHYWGTRENSKESTSDQWMVDINGDGLTDYVYQKEGKYEYRVLLNNGGGYDDDQYWGARVNSKESKSDQWMEDMNGDGLTDYVYQENGTSDYRVLLNNGSGYGDDQYWGTRENSKEGSSDQWMVDLNGDGLTDYIYKKKGTRDYRVLLNNRSGYEDDQYWGTRDNAIDSTGDQWMVDINGDGLTDYVYQENGTRDYRVLLNNGSGYEDDQYWGTRGNSKEGTSDQWMVDMNGDGLTDYAYQEGGSDDYRVLLNNGSGYEDDQYWGTRENSKESTSDQWMMDINGDGLIDYVYQEDGTRDYSVLLNKPSVPDILTTLTNGLGGQTTIEYNPLTDASIYTGGTFCAIENADCTFSGTRRVKYGAESSWKYGAFTGGVSCSSSTFGDPLPNAVKACYLLSDYPTRDIQNPMLAVSQHTINDGRTTVNDGSSHTYTFRHRYTGGKVSLDGRGWLGFATSTLINAQSSTETVTRYYQDFPLTGIPETVEVFSRDGQQSKKLFAEKDDYGSLEQSGIYTTFKNQDSLNYYIDGVLNHTRSKDYVYDEAKARLLWVQNHTQSEGSEHWTYECFSYQPVPNDPALLWQSFFPKTYKISGEGTPCAKQDFSNLELWVNGDLKLQQYSQYDAHMNPNRQEGWDDTKNKWIPVQAGYDSYGNTTSVTDPLGNRTEMTYDNTYHTFPVTITAPPAAPGAASLTSESTYEPNFGTQIQSTDANGNVVMRIPVDGLDKFGRIIKIEGIQPESTTLLTLSTRAFTQEQGGMSVTTYARPQWDSSAAASSWLWTTVHIDAMGRTYQTESIGPKSNKTILSDVIFNAQGQVYQESLPYFSGDSPQYIVHEYDDHHRPWRITAPDGAVQEIDYSELAAMQLIQESPDPTDIETGTNLVSYTHQNDDRDLLTSVTGPDGSVTAYKYDPLGRRTRITDPLGDITHFTFNSMGQLTEADKPELGTSTFEYDDNSRLSKSTDANGHILVTEYDGVGRFTAKKMFASASGYPDSPQKTDTYTYDQGVNGKGRVYQITSSDRAYLYTFAYDLIGRVNTQTIEQDTNDDGHQETFTTQSSYDPLGNPETLTYPDGSVVKYVSTASGYLHNVQLKKPSEATFTNYATYGGAAGTEYNAFGQVGEVLYDVNGVMSAFMYDVIGRLKTSATTKGALQLRDFTYTWNKAGKLLDITDQRINPDIDLSEHFRDPADKNKSGYDIRSRLIHAQGPYGAESYQYNEGSNMTRKITRLADTAYDYQSPTNHPDAKHQLTSACRYADLDNGSCPTDKQTLRLTYDNNGNVLTKDMLDDGITWHYSYDLENQLIRVEQQVSGAAKQKVYEFAYNAAGSRILKIEYDSDGSTVRARTSYITGGYEVDYFPGQDSQHTQYILGPQGVIAAITEAQSTVQAGLVPGENGPGYPVSGQTRFFHRDHLGSSTLITDETGAETSSVVYQPYGSIDKDSSSGTNDFRPKYTGKEIDHNSGLTYFGARYYDSDIGRFLTPDPAGQQHSPYMYVGGDPMSRIDPDGRWSVGSAISGAYNFSVAHIPGVHRGDKLIGILAPDFEEFLTTGNFGTVPGFFVGFGKEVANIAISVINMTNVVLFVELAGGSKIPEFNISDDQVFGAGVAEVALFFIPGGEEEEAGSAIGAEEADARLGAEEDEGGGLEAAGDCRFLSFVEDTEVITAEGKKDIEDVEVGDAVWSYNEKTAKNEINVVTGTFNSLHNDLITVSVDGHLIGTTSKHPFYVKEKGWVEAARLVPGDLLITLDGIELPIESVLVENTTESFIAYNFSVDNAQTYFVSEKDVLVHNCFIGLVRRLFRRQGNAVVEAADAVVGDAPWQLGDGNVLGGVGDLQLNITAEGNSLNVNVERIYKDADYANNYNESVFTRLTNQLERLAEAQGTANIQIDFRNVTTQDVNAYGNPTSYVYRDARARAFGYRADAPVMEEDGAQFDYHRVTWRRVRH